MATIKYEGEVPDATLLAIATFHGWQATVMIDDVETENPESYQAYATLRVLGRAFMAVTTHEWCIPEKDDLSPKAYEIMKETISNEILTTSKVYLNNTQIHP